MPALQFRFQLTIDHPELLPELQSRAADLRPAFQEIIVKWAKNNEAKFAASKGMEESGATVDETGVFWEKLTTGYIASKRKAGYGNQIMVRTGSLEHALESLDFFTHETTAQQAAFGTPTNPDDEAKVKYNWNKRQVIFLGLSDEKAIEHTILNYLSFGENFKDVIFQRGLANARARAEAAQMDVDFGQTMGGAA